MTIERPPNRRATTLERAYELARSGKYPGVQEIRKQLAAEGFDDARTQLVGPALKADLFRLCVASGGAPTRSPPWNRRMVEKEEVAD